ncbi:transglycosylase SLT domain-containing protein [Cupriavidus basilensis]
MASGRRRRADGGRSRLCAGLRMPGLYGFHRCRWRRPLCRPQARRALSKLFMKDGGSFDTSREAGAAAVDLEQHKLYRYIVNHPNIAKVEPMIRQIADKQDVDPALVKAVMAVESGFNPSAVSPKGAIGLMQVHSRHRRTFRRERRRAPQRRGKACRSAHQYLRRRTLPALVDGAVPRQPGTSAGRLQRWRRRGAALQQPDSAVPGDAAIREHRAAVLPALQARRRSCREPHQRGSRRAIARKDGDRRTAQYALTRIPEQQATRRARLHITARRLLANPWNNKTSRFNLKSRRIR